MFNEKTATWIVWACAFTGGFLVGQALTFLLRSWL